MPLGFGCVQTQESRPKHRILQAEQAWEDSSPVSCVLVLHRKNLPMVKQCQTNILVGRNSLSASKCMVPPLYVIYINLWEGSLLSLLRVLGAGCPSLQDTQLFRLTVSQTLGEWNLGRWRFPAKKTLKKNDKSYISRTDWLYFIIHQYSSLLFPHLQLSHGNFEDIVQNLQDCPRLHGWCFFP